MAQLWYVSLLSLMVWWLLLGPIPCHCQNPMTAFEENDIICLNEIKGDLKDPYESLFTWRFGNSSQGFICNFAGVQCWHNDDGKVLSVKLPSMNLQGSFPEGLKYCGSMTTLDLSGNNLSGSIPKDLCKWLPYLVYIDLSGNQFTGSIPHELFNCTYLNALRLNHNRLSGSIPWELALLERLKDFNFANNKLSGQIPLKWARNSSDLFINNAGLCGNPLPKSCMERKSSSTPVVAGIAAAGVLVVCLFGFAFWWAKDEVHWAKRPKTSPQFTRTSEMTQNKNSVHVNDI